MGHSRGRDLISLFVALALIGAVVVLVFWQWPLIKLIISDPEQIRVYITSYGMWAPLVFCVIYVLLVVIAVLPASVLNLLSGIMFGFWQGLGLSWLCTVIGALIAITLMRGVARSIMRLFVNVEKLRKFDDFVRKRGWAYLFLLYVLPNPLGDTLNYVGAASDIRFYKLLIMVGIGRLPVTFFRVFLGVNMVHLPAWTWVLLIVLWLGVVAGLYFLHNHINRFAERFSVKFFPQQEQNK